MAKTDFKPVYAENNLDWRIAYFPGGWWQLQERITLPDGTDLRRRQPWKAHNSRMSFNGAMMALSGKAIRKGMASNG